MLFLPQPWIALDGRSNRGFTGFEWEHACAVWGSLGKTHKYVLTHQLHSCGGPIPLTSTTQNHTSSAVARAANTTATGGWPS